MDGPAQPKSRASQADDGRRGPSAIEYALIAALIGALAMCLASAAEGALKSPFKSLSDAIAAPNAKE